MRAALAAGSIALVLLPGAALAASASRQDAQTGHLKLIKEDLYAAITTESRAIESAKADDWSGADTELDQARKALFALQGLVGYTEQPAELVDAAPNDPWAHFASWTAEAKNDDSRARIRSVRSPKIAIGLLQSAERLKNQMYALVVNELSHPNCTELVDVRGPIVVNGVPQGRSTVTVDFSCRRPVTGLYVDLVGAAVQSPQLDKGTITLLPSGVLHLHELSRQFEITFQPSVEPSPSEKLDIVEIAGDSSEYFQEVM